jgi:Tol biopolymer transport system component
MPFTPILQSFRRPGPSDIITRVSTMADGGEGPGGTGPGSQDAELSANGRYVLFDSYAKLAPSDTGIWRDVYLKDVTTGAITHVSTTTDGVQGNGSSDYASLSADGRYVVFESNANNLAPGDTNNKRDIFRKDLVTGTVVRVSTPDQGGSDNDFSSHAQITADGRYVLFESVAGLLGYDTNGKNDIYFKDVQTNELRIVSLANGWSEQSNGWSEKAQFGPDGSSALFESIASNFVPNDTNGKADIFIKKFDDAGTVIHVSSAADGTGGNGTSGDAQFSRDGRYVVFESDSTNLVAGDTNGTTDIFRKDLVTGAVVRLSTASNGSESNGTSQRAQLSADGRYLLFQSDANNLVAGDTNGKFDAFRKDLVTGEVVRLSVGINGAQGNDHSYRPQLSQDGRYAVFESSANNLVPGDTNGWSDVFRVDVAMMANQAAIAEGRFVDVSLGVGAATSVEVAWGDGEVDTVIPASGTAALAHAYGTTGTKAATVTVRQGAHTWVGTYQIDLAAGQMALTSVQSDTFPGGAGNDVIRGSIGIDLLLGGIGNDKLFGDSGDDRLNGGVGKDELTGGKGRDAFVFDVKPKKGAADKIKDYKAKDDAIWLENSIFTKLGKAGSELKPAKLKKAYFAYDQAKDGNDYLVYVKKTGKLLWDVDGSGGKPAVEIATLTNKAALSAGEFFVI